MSSQPLLFGEIPRKEVKKPHLGLVLKEQGMELAAKNRAELLEHAREVARKFARQHGSVTADDIPEHLRLRLGPAAGSIFKGSEWDFTGERIISNLPSNHGRELKVWRLKP